MKAKGYIAIVAVIVALGAVIVFLGRPDSPATQPTPAPPPAINTDRVAASWPQLIKGAAAPPLGNPKAPYTFIEVGDFQCPNCGEAEPLIVGTVGRSKGMVKLYFINFPLNRVHPHAQLAAEASMSAAAQGKFWPMYNLLYAQQDELIPSEIVYNSKSIPGLNWHQLQSDLDTHKYAGVVAKSAALAVATGIGSTPTLFLRDPHGKITTYVGTGGGGKIPGIITAAADPPWGGGIGVQAATAIVNSKKDAEQ